MKKYLQYIYPVATLAALYLTLNLADNAGQGWHNAAGRDYYYIYMMFYLFTGIIITLDLWLANKAIKKHKLFLSAERLILVVAMFFFSPTVFSAVYLGKQVWIVAASIQIATSIIYLF